MVLSAGTSTMAVSWHKNTSAFFCLNQLSFFSSLFSPLQKIPGKFKKLFTELESLTVSTVLGADQHCLPLPVFLLPNVFGGCLLLSGAGACHVRSVIYRRPHSSPELRGGLQTHKKKEAAFVTAGRTAESSVGSPASIWKLFFYSGG